jgi:LuxR family quorum-sensing system transcriptional regulator SolR
MPSPARTDSAELSTLLDDWLEAVEGYAVTAIVVLGPNPLGGADDRRVLAAAPAAILDAAHSLARSDDFGATWRQSNASLVAWQHLGKSDLQGAENWRSQCLRRGLQSMVRVAFPLPAHRAFEVYMFSPHELHDRQEAAVLGWSALSVWPSMRAAITRQHSPLTAREVQCLSLAFEGMTAQASANRLGCSERTVNFHLANAMGKLRADNKMAAIQRACWIGAL